MISFNMRMVSFDFRCRWLVHGSGRAFKFCFHEISYVSDLISNEILITQSIKNGL